jgi:ribonuclease G
LIDEIEGKIKYAFRDLNKKKLLLKVHPYVAAYLTKGFKSIRNKWYLEYFKWVKIEAVNSYTFLEYHFFDNNQDELIL